VPAGPGGAGPEVQSGLPRRRRHCRKRPTGILQSRPDSGHNRLPRRADRERAALAWAEALTKLTNKNVPDEIYEAAREQFTDEELIDLTFGVLAINSYNRINIAFRPPVGTYKVGQHAVAAN